MKNKEFYKLLKKNKSKPNSGFTLTELLVGLVMSIFVIGALGFGLMQILRVTQKGNSETAARNESSRALDFISDEMRRAEAIEVVKSFAYLSTDDDASTTEIDEKVAPDFSPLKDSSNNDIQPSLVLKIPGLDQRVIYTVAPPQTDTWKGPLVIYRWGPTLDSNGNYTNGNDGSAWGTSVALVDGISNEDVTADGCDMDGDGNDETYKGFLACVVDDDGDLIPETADSNKDGYVLAVAEDVDGDGINESKDTAAVDVNGDGTIDDDDLDMNQDGKIDAGDNADSDGIAITAQLYFTAGTKTAAGESGTYSADTKVVARARSAPDGNSPDLAPNTMNFRTLNPSFSCNTSPQVDWEMRTDFGESLDNPGSLTNWNHEENRLPQPIKITGNKLVISSIPRGIPIGTKCLNSRINNGREDTNPSERRDYSGNKGLGKKAAWKNNPNVVAISHVIDFGDPTTFNGDIKNTCDSNYACGGSVKVNDGDSDTMNTSIVMLKRGSIVPNYGGYDANNDGDTNDPGEQKSLGEFLLDKGLATNTGSKDAPVYEIISIQEDGKPTILGDDERIIAFEVGHEVSTADTTPSDTTNPGIDYQDNIFVVQSSKFKEKQFDAYTVN